MQPGSPLSGREADRLLRRRGKAPACVAVRPALVGADAAILGQRVADVGQLGQPAPDRLRLVVRHDQHPAPPVVGAQGSSDVGPVLLLVDQGEADQFLARELRPEALEAAAQASGQKLRLRRHAGYDHGYYFIQTFVADHLRHHAAQLV